MICKITAVNSKHCALSELKPKNVNSSQSLSNYCIPNLLKTKLKPIKEAPDYNKKKIDLEIVMVSERFFDFLPRVQRMTSSLTEKLSENKNNNNEAWS